MPTTIDDPKTEKFYFTGFFKHRFNIGEYVIFNRTLPHPKPITDIYSDNGIGLPRIDFTQEIIRRFLDINEGRAVPVCELGNKYKYLPHHLTYRPFKHCCGGAAIAFVPKNKINFVRALWMIVGGSKPDVTWGIRIAHPTHYHDIVFDADFSQVGLHIGQYQGSPMPTNMETLRRISKSFNKMRLAYNMPVGPKRDDFHSNESKLLAKKSQVAKSNYDYYTEELEKNIRNLEYQKGQLSNNLCSRNQLVDAISCASAMNKNFSIVDGILSDYVDYVANDKKRVANTEKMVISSRDSMVNAEKILSRTEHKSCLEMLSRFKENGIIKGVEFRNGVMEILFLPFNIPIAPKVKCDFGNTHCRCQIVNKGIIKIGNFILTLQVEGNGMKFGLKSHIKQTIHPHFAPSTNNYCLGGYEESIYDSLNKFNLIEFLAIFADYIHSFNVHSMLNSYSLIPCFDSDGAAMDLFKSDPDNYEDNDGNDDDEDEDEGRAVRF